MNKEFEALEYFADSYKEFLKGKDTHCQITLTREQATEFVKEVKDVYQALTELKAIKEAKPSEAMKELDEIIEYITEDKKVKYKATILFDCEIIKQALLKLDFLEDAIDLPINCSWTLKNRNGNEVTIIRRERYEEYQEQEKVLEIIFKKNVDMFELKCCSSAKSYNECISFKIGFIKNYELTEEEFELLKRYLNGK